MAYAPENVPDRLEDLPRFLRSELARVAEAYAEGLAKNVEFLAVAPAKPREGALYGADGTHWNPGSGKGVYCFYNSTWHFLG